MAYYVDNTIDNNPTYLPDSTTQPMGWLDFVNGPDTVYYVKGDRDDSSRVLYLANKDVRAWDLVAFGPWRINVQTVTGTVGASSDSWSLRDGVVAADNVIIQGAAAARSYYFYDVHFIVANKLSVSSSVLGVPVNMNFKGCSLRCDSIGVEVGTAEAVLDGLNFVDCSVDVNTNVNRGDQFDHSVFNKPQSSWNNATLTVCQFDWVTPTWPVWNAIKDSWKYTVLGANISINSSGSFVGYPTGLYGISRTIAAGIGAFFFDASNYRVYVTQSTNRHVIKRLDSNVTPAVYDGQHYGLYEQIGRLKYPTGVAAKGADIFVCDYKNSRVLRLNRALDYISEYDTSSTIDKPYLIHYDVTTDDLYVLGVTPSRWDCKLERLTINLLGEFESVKVSDYLGKFSNGMMPTGLCRGFGVADFLVCGTDNDLFSTTETTNSFTSFVAQTITGRSARRYMGMIHHSNGDVYLNDGNRLIRVNSTFENCGVSDFISRTIYGLKETISDTIMLYDVENFVVMKYDDNLNFVSAVFSDSGTVIEADAKNIMDFLELDLIT